MLYLFHGTDTQKSGDKARSLITSLRAKRPDAAFVSVTANDWNSSIIEEHLGGQGLFSNKYIIFLNRVTENEEAKENLAAFIPAMNESANIFIVHEGKLNAELKKAFEKSSEKIVVTDLAEAKSSSRFASSAAGTGGRSDFNIFALADAFGSRDSSKVWSIYRQAIDAGIEPENIIGTLFWQVKSMIQAGVAKSATEAGLSPFVFSKAKKYSDNYSGEEIQGLTEKLITIYHDGHRGLRDMEWGLERLMLGVLKSL